MTTKRNTIKRPASRRLGSPYPLKFESDVQSRMKTASRKHRIPFPDVARMSIREGFPIVKTRLTSKAA